MANNMSASFGEHSRLDWGGESSSLRGDSVAGSSLGPSVDSTAGVVANGGRAAPPSRYDPKAMSKIVDITDLVDSDHESSDDEDIFGHTSDKGNIGVLTRSGSDSNVTKPNNKLYGPGGIGSSFIFKQLFILFMMLAVIVGACVAMGYAVYGVQKTPGVEDNQQLLEQAERVILACGEGRLNEDMTECQSLCQSRMCCFDSGKYNCENDESKACAVFAGCEALADGALLSFEDELEEEN